MNIKNDLNKIMEVSPADFGAADQETNWEEREKETIYNPGGAGGYSREQVRQKLKGYMKKMEEALDHPDRPDLFLHYFQLFVTWSAGVHDDLPEWEHELNVLQCLYKDRR